MNKAPFKVSILLCKLLLLLNCFTALGREIDIDKNVKEYVNKAMEEAKIPGLSMVFISENKQTILNFGYANLEMKKKINDKTLYQLGSCSKAFTALAIISLQQMGKLNLDSSVSYYIPWFKLKFKDKVVKVTLRQLLHHTSGISWSTISDIPQSNKANALEETVKRVVNTKLRRLPGKQYEYATINYDILALVVEKITFQPFETYLQENIFKKLNLRHTTFNILPQNKLMARGYKIGFFNPREYNAPIYRGNNAAGYVISNAKDLGRWLQFQMGLIDSGFGKLVNETHKRDETVPPDNAVSYAAGWFVSLRGDGQIYHDGMNPNYSSYIGFRPKQQIGVAVMANSNSAYTAIIGNNVLKLLAGEATENILPEDRNDKVYSIGSILTGIYILIVLSFLAYIVIKIGKKERIYDGITFDKLLKLILHFGILLPFLYGIYKLPKALTGFTWGSILVWAPVSFKVLILLVLIALGVSYFTYFISLCFPEKNKFKRLIPQILLMSILSGIANMVVILLVTSALNSNIEAKYLVFYYILNLIVYLYGRRFVQVNLIKFSRDLIFDLRIKLIDKLFSTSYQKFEKIDRGLIYTSLNDDVGTVGDSINMFVMLVTSFFTAIGAFLYLATVAFWATLITGLMVLVLATLYFFVSRSTNRFFEEARDVRNVFMRLINGMIDGFKELSLHKNKKIEYREDVAACANEYRVKISTANIRFVNASLVGESVLIVILGVVAFSFPRLFPNIQIYTLMSFVIILLYLIGPVNAILGSVPAVMNLRIAWKRIQHFLGTIPANMTLEKTVPSLDNTIIDKLKAEEIYFEYQSDNGIGAFAIGPINLEVKKGEILFIIGGNGSGKTTFAKLLTGLYEPNRGKFKINDKVIDSSELGESFSSVFSPVYLFEKLYNINLTEKGDEIIKYLKLLKLDDKVVLNGNQYSTVNLSGGQRKRLALFQCYLEDSPIYLFDEWAADQDPEFRQFFYKILLPEMKRKGKIIIAITHDDHYFDVADKVLKLNQGVLEVINSN